MMQQEKTILAEHGLHYNGTQDDDPQKWGNTAILSTTQKAPYLNEGEREQLTNTNGEGELALAVAMEQAPKIQDGSVPSVRGAAAEAREAGSVDAESHLGGQELLPTKSELSPISGKHPQTTTTMSSSSVEPLSASQDFTGTRKSSGATVPEPFRFSLDSRPRRSSDGALQVTPDGPSQRRPRSSSQTGPSLKGRSSGVHKVQTMQKPFNLEGLKRHEKALEQLHAEVAAKEAAESAPRGFRARPILKPDVGLPTRVIAPPTKPSAFKLSVEDRAERRDKFKKQVEEREQQLESEREKMLQELKKELDKEEKHVRRNSSFKAAPARITPDDKVFKPKLGQSPKTTPRAPVLGLQRRHSTGSQEGNTSATSPAAASTTPGTSLGPSKTPSRLPSKPASPRVSKPASPVVGKAPSPTPGKVLSPRASKASSPITTPSPGPSATPSSRLSKPAPPKTPVQKLSPSTRQPASPRLNKPASPKSGPPKNAQASSASTSASPLPASAAVPRVSTRRNGNTTTGEVAGKPGPKSGSATSPTGVHVTRLPAAGSGKQAPRPLSASKPNVDSTRTPTGPSLRGMTRPQSASARKNTPGPAAEPSPRKILNPKADNKAALEDKEAERSNSKSAPPDSLMSEKMDEKEVTNEAGVNHGEDMLSEPAAKPGVEESTPKVMQLEQTKEISEVELESPVEANVAKKDGQTTVKENGIAVTEV